MHGINQMNRRTGSSTLFSLLLLFAAFAVSSCKQGSESKDILPTDDSRISVQEGRLFFQNKRSYRETVLSLIDKQFSQQNEWLRSKGLDFHPLVGDTSQHFMGPSMYKVLLNTAGEIQIGDTIMKISGDTVALVPYSKKELLLNFESAQLDLYKKSFVRDISNGSNKGARNPAPPGVIRYRDGSNYYEFQPGGSFGGYTFRYIAECKEYLDQSARVASVGVSLYLEYYNTGRNAWYQAVQYGNFSMKNIHWTGNGAVYYGIATDYSFVSPGEHYAFFHYDDIYYGHTPTFYLDLDWSGGFYGNQPRPYPDQGTNRYGAHAHFQNLDPNG